MKKLLMTAIAAVALALPAGAIAHHQPGHQGGGGNNDNTVTINAPAPIVFGANTTINGTLQGPNNAGVAVELEADEFPYADNEFAKVAEGVTDAQGNYTFTATPTLNTRYRVLARTSPPVTSVPATQLVRIKVTRRVSDKTPDAGDRVRFRGTACPEHDGNEVRIQRRVNGKWRTRKKTTLQADPGTCSTYRTRVRINGDGVYRVVVLDPAGHHLKGRSKRVRLDVNN